MSGGYFDYKQSMISYIADELEDYIIKCERNEERDYGYTTNDKDYVPYHYEESDEVMIELREGLKLLRKAYVYAQRIDWYLSCDDSEKSFFERLKEELAELKSDE